MNRVARAFTISGLFVLAPCSRAEPARAQQPVAPDASPRVGPVAAIPVPVQGSGMSVERVSFSQARTFLWPRSAPDTTRCESNPDPVRCLLDARWSAWPDANARVDGMWRDLGTVCGVERAQLFDGAYRGIVQIVPEFPVGRYAQHLVWVERALRDQDAFYRDVAAHAPRAIAYRWTGLGILFHRTVNTRTPAAYASDWTFAYNVVGGINSSLERIRLTILHEVFHLNDAEHHHWSHTALQPIYAAVLRRCGSDTACLSPYAPSQLRVRRTGMYYSFQSGNSDVGEYAATLCERYYLEQTRQWRGRPFRCTSPENAAAWRAIVDEFFGGHDDSPGC
ncbi:MAG: hypothetical protein WCJ30_17725 [Deltaproteobacteria bacterium]